MKSLKEYLYDFFNVLVYTSVMVYTALVGLYFPVRNPILFILYSLLVNIILFIVLKIKKKDDLSWYLLIKQVFIKLIIFVFVITPLLMLGNLLELNNYIRVLFGIPIVVEIIGILDRLKKLGIDIISLINKGVIDFHKIKKDIYDASDKLSSDK